LNALKVDNKLVLDFVTVLDQFSLRRDDTAEVKLVETTREHWEKRATKKTVAVAEKILDILNAKLEQPQQLNYNKHYIGLNDGTKSRNFVYFKPKKQFTHIFFEVKDKDAWVEKLDAIGISATSYKKDIQVTVKPQDLNKNLEVFDELTQDAVNYFIQ